MGERGKTREAIQRYLVRIEMLRIMKERPEYVENVLRLLQPRVSTFSDMEASGDFFFYPLEHTGEDMLKLSLNINKKEEL